MLKDVKIGRRLGLAFGSVLLLTGAVCAASYWGLQTMDSMAREVLKVAYPLVAQSQQARSSTLALRRFEKDGFLNIGNAEKEAEYLDKWTEQKQGLDESLAALDKLVQNDADRDTVRAMRADTLAYEEGFHKVWPRSARARSRRRRTPTRPSRPSRTRSGVWSPPPPSSP